MKKAKSPKDWMYRTAGSILARLGLEVHKKQAGYAWTSLPLSREFIETYKRYNVKEMSYVSVASLHALYQMLSYAVKLPGSVAQLGVYKGGSVAMLAPIVERTNKTYFLFDTFEGLPPTSKEDNVGGYDKEAVRPFADAPIEQVSEYLRDFNCLVYEKGYFPESAIYSRATGKEFCFVYLDADLYQSTKDALDFFYPRLVEGGVIVFDDYGGRRWAGVKTAIDEFMPGHSEAALIQLAPSQAVMIKTKV